MKARSKSIPKEILRSFFETNQYPTKPQKEELTNKTDFSLRKVSFWFNDERKKHGISKGKPAVVECGKCTFHSSQKYVMAEHKYREHGEKTLGCKLCDFKSHDRTAVRYHTLTMHRAHGEKAIDCKLCDYKSYDRSTVTKHAKTRHREHGEKTIDCKLCDFKSFNKKYVRDHTKAKHMEKNQKCDLCDYKTALRGNLNEHKRSAHEGLNYNCNECDWSSKRKESL